MSLHLVFCISHCHSLENDHYDHDQLVSSATLGSSHDVFVSKHHLDCDHIDCHVLRYHCVDLVSDSPHLKPLFFHVDLVSICHLPVGYNQVLHSYQKFGRKMKTRPNNQS